ncbi:MAG: hypothetical protein H6R26_1487, partial [Proteobacteria bacterium]|nr:hypothetical protein [Pseudomonadota bacterium]
MNRFLRRAVALSLTGSVFAALPGTAAAITVKDTLEVSSGASAAGSGNTAANAWDGSNSSAGTPVVHGGSSQYLGWAHNSAWYYLHIADAGDWTISLRRADSSKTYFNPAFTVWSTGDLPYDGNGYKNSPQHDSWPIDGTHSYNQVAPPNSANASAWMTGAEPFPWTPAPGKSAVQAFVGYANSGFAFTNGTPYGSGSPPNGSHDQDSVVGGGGVIASPYSGTVNAVTGSGLAKMELTQLPAGYYLVALGGSCTGSSTCPRAKVTANYIVGVSPAGAALPTPPPTPSPTPKPSASPSPSPTDAPSASPSPSASPTPTPPPANVDCSTNPPPVLDTVVATFDATAGEELNFTVTAMDYCDEAITVKTAKKPKGLVLTSQDFDENNKWAANIKWTPTPGQANKKYKLVLTAVQDQKNGKASAKQKTVIRVWPRGKTAETGSVNKV